MSFHRPNWALDAGSRSLGFDPSLKYISARSCLASHIGHVCTAQCIPTDVQTKPGLGVLPAQRVLGCNMHAFLLSNPLQLFGIVGSVGQTSRHLCPQLRCSYSGAASTFVARLVNVYSVSLWNTSRVRRALRPLECRRLQHLTLGPEESQPRDSLREMPMISSGRLNVPMAHTSGKEQASNAKAREQGVNCLAFRPSEYIR